MDLPILVLMGIVIVLMLFALSHHFDKVDDLEKRILPAWREKVDRQALQLDQARMEMLDLKFAKQELEQSLAIAQSLDARLELLEKTSRRRDADADVILAELRTALQGIFEDSGDLRRSVDTRQKAQ